MDDVTLELVNQWQNSLDIFTIQINRATATMKEHFSIGKELQKRCDEKGFEFSEVIKRL